MKRNVYIYDFMFSKKIVSKEIDLLLKVKCILSSI